MNKKLEKATKQSWYDMKKRCKDTTYPTAKYYRDRGVKVCDRWQDSYENFLEDMGICPFENFTIDRIDSEKDYSPENCRWASKFLQQWNRNFSAGELRGVHFNVARDKWQAHVKLGGRSMNLGYYESEEEAKKVRGYVDRAIDRLIEIGVIR